MFQKERMEKIYQFLWIITNEGIWGENSRSRHLARENSTSILSSRRNFLWCLERQNTRNLGPWQKLCMKKSNLIYQAFRLAVYCSRMFLLSPHMFLPDK